MKFDMNKAWAEAIAMIKGNLELLLIIAGLFFLIPNMVFSLVFPVLPEGFTGTPQDIALMQTMMNDFAVNYWWLILLVFTAILLGWLAMMALLRDDAKPTVGTAMTKAVRGLLPSLAVGLIFLFGTSLLQTLLVNIGALSGLPSLAALGGMTGLIATFVIAIRMTLITPVIVDEPVSSPLKAILRSWRLTQNNGLRLFAFFGLIFIAYLVMTAVASIVMSVIMLVIGEGLIGFLASATGGLLASAVLTLLVAVIASIHRQLGGASTPSVRAHFD